MSVSQLAAGIDRLVALFGAALPGVTVADGLQVNEKFVGDWAVIGGDGGFGDDEEAGRGVAQWSGIGTKRRDEQLNIPCAIGSSSGNAESSMKPRRDRAFALLDLVDGALRADPGIADFVTGGGAAINEVSLKYMANTQGLAAVVLFVVHIPVRI